MRFPALRPTIRLISSIFNTLVMNCVFCQVSVTISNKGEANTCVGLVSGTTKDPTAHMKCRYIFEGAWPQTGCAGPTVGVMFWLGLPLCRGSVAVMPSSLLDLGCSSRGGLRRLLHEEVHDLREQVVRREENPPRTSVSPRGNRAKRDMVATRRVKRLSESHPKMKGLWSVESGPMRVVRLVETGCPFSVFVSPDSTDEAMPPTALRSLLHLACHRGKDSSQH